MKRDDSGRDASGSDGATTPAWATVRDPLAGRLLSDPASIEFLVPFLAREASISGAARELGRPLEAVRYRVRRFVRAGLLEVIREVPRAGRPIRIYRTVADGFVVPFEATPYADLEERMRASLAAGDEVVARAAARAMRASGVEARRIYRDRRGEVHQEAAADREELLAGGGDAIEAYAMTVPLSRERAHEVLRELFEWFERIRLEAEAAGEGEGTAGRPYHLAFQIAPRDT